MTRSEYAMRKARKFAFATSASKNLQELRTRLREQTQNQTPHNSTRRNFSLSWMICAIVVVWLFFLILATAAQATTLKLEDRLPRATYADTLWTSPAPIPSIVISIYVLPSLLDSLESALDTLSCTSTLTQIKPSTVSGTTN